MKHLPTCDTNVYEGQGRKCDCPAKDTVQVSQTPAEDDTVMACIKCGALRDLVQVAHRNFGENIVGIMIVCADCKEDILKGSLRLEIK